jgi:hypothetical protein
MNWSPVIQVGEVAGGLLVGMALFSVLLRRTVNVVMTRRDALVLKLPFLGEIQTNAPMRCEGIFIEEWEELTDKLAALGQLLDPDIVFRYARDYGICYVGLEGDRGDKSWSGAKLAYATPAEGYRKGQKTWAYKVYLNPHLNVQDVSKRLSDQLGERISPTEVQTFLFFHEVGHTGRAGNQDYFAAMVNHSLSGGRRSAKRRRQLRLVLRKIEWYADQFALQELRALRAARLLDGEYGKSACVVSAP